MPKVSVIIPVYGVERYIERCARSLFEQTLDKMEFIFIDDCTPDSSIKILRNVLEEYPNRKKNTIIHRMSENSGQAMVRRWGIENAKGEYVIQCDSDDWVEKEMYKMMYDKVNENQADISVCDMALTDGKNNYKVQKCCKSNEPLIFLEDCMLHRVTPSLCNKLIRRSLFVENKINWPSESMAEDLTTTSQILWFVNKMVYIEKPFYNYFHNQNSISKKKGDEHTLRIFRESCANIAKVSDFYTKRIITNTLRAALLVAMSKQRDRILAMTWRHKYYVLWKETFPEINSELLTNNSVPFQIKLRYILGYMKIYPITAKLRGL